MSIKKWPISQKRMVLFHEANTVLTGVARRPCPVQLFVKPSFSLDKISAGSNELYSIALFFQASLFPMANGAAAA